MRKGKMKLTKQTLKRIIKEELEAFVNEVEEQDLEEATDAPKKFSPEWWAEFEKEFNPKNNQDQEAPEETPSVRDPSQPPAGYVSGIDDDIPPDFKIPRRNMRKYKGR